MKCIGKQTAFLSVLAIAMTCSAAYAEPLCESYETQTTQLARPALNELSGIALSRSNPRYFWGHVDSGGSASVYLINRAGAVVREYGITGVEAKDWEDIAVGPCGPDSEKDCIYISDMGNNLAVVESDISTDDLFHRRNNLKIFMFEEPDVSGDIEYGLSMSVPVVKTWHVTYPTIDDPKHIGGEVTNPDCESIMVSPDTSDIYFITKQSHGYDLQRLFHLPWDSGADAVPEEIGAYKFHSSGAGEYSETFNAVTAAAFAPDGKHFLVRTYAEIFEYDLEEYTDIAEAFNHPRLVITSHETQGESVEYDRDGRSIVTAEEAFPRVIGFGTMSFHTCDVDGTLPGIEDEEITWEDQSIEVEEPIEEAPETEGSHYYELYCSPIGCEITLTAMKNGKCPRKSVCSLPIAAQLFDTATGDRLPVDQALIYVKKSGDTVTLEPSSGALLTDEEGRVEILVTSGESAGEAEIKMTTSENRDSKEVTLKIHITAAPDDPDPVDTGDSGEPDDYPPPEAEPCGGGGACSGIPLGQNSSGMAVFWICGGLFALTVLRRRKRTL